MAIRRSAGSGQKDQTESQLLAMLHMSGTPLTGMRGKREMEPLALRMASLKDSSSSPDMTDTVGSRVSRGDRAPGAHVVLMEQRVRSVPPPVFRVPELQLSANLYLLD